MFDFDDLYSPVSFCDGGGGGGEGPDQATCDRIDATATGLGIISVATGAGAAIPSPATPGLTAVSIGTGVAGLAVDAYGNAIGC